MSAATIGPSSPRRAIDFSDDPAANPDEPINGAALPTWHSSYGDLIARLGYARRLHGGLRDQQISDLCLAMGVPDLTQSGSSEDDANVEVPDQLSPLPSILVVGPKGTGKTSVVRQMLSGVLLKSRAHRSMEVAFDGITPVGKIDSEREGVIVEQSTKETFRIPVDVPLCSGCSGNNIYLYVDCHLCSSVSNVMSALLATLDRTLADPEMHTRVTSTPIKSKKPEATAEANSPPTTRKRVRAATPSSGTPARKTRSRVASVCTPGGTGPDMETPVRRSARKAARSDWMWLADQDKFTISDDLSQAWPINSSVGGGNSEAIPARLPTRLEPVAEDMSEGFADMDEKDKAAALPAEDMQLIARRFLQSVAEGPSGAAKTTVPKTLPSSVMEQIERYSRNSARRVDGTGFAKKFTDLLRSYDALNKTVFVVVDQAERLLPDAADPLEPANDAARLMEFLLDMSDELCLPNACSVIVSSTPIPRDSRGVVHFPPYNNAEAIALLSAYCHARSPMPHFKEAVTAFSSMYVKFFYDSLIVTDMTSLVGHALDVYNVEYTRIVDETWGRATLEGCVEEDDDDDDDGDDTISPAMRREVISVSQIELKSTLSEHMTFIMTRGATKAAIKWESHLPYNARLLVLAGFLASHNPPSMDNRLFMMKTGRSSRATVTRIRNNQIAMDSINVRPPKPFPLQRMLEIARYLHHGEMRMTSDVFQEVRRLVHLRLLMTNGDPSIDAWMEGAVKLTTGLHSYPVVEELAVSARYAGSAAGPARTRRTQRQPKKANSSEATVQAAGEAEVEPQRQTAAYQIMSTELKQRVEEAFVAEANRLKAEQIPVAKAIEIFYKTGIVHPKRWPVPDIVEELRYRGWSRGFHIKATYYPQPPDPINRETAVELAKWLRIVDRKKRELEAQSAANK
ncbi:Origin recognition complex subunit 5 [Perkinsus chesapeaki]|uniref:Origin recognition complex subunit 5 n=1 Tax=Perkinsus chesapeaki TaxID=330153 RepID=A0A7J6N1L7_PERCH|nr:Origin recognition complex subunit 5 [Perkinsus chesapeaki]